MKTLKSLIIIVLSLSCIYLHAQTTYEWEYVNTLQNETLQKIYTQGLDTVYIVGKNGLIAQSTNRALTWNKQYFGGGVALNDVTFINHFIGFAVGANGTILKTTDAGVNWILMASETTNNLNGIAATGLDNIWIIGDNGTVLCSVDGGNVWTIRNEILTTQYILSDIEFVDSNIGFIVGEHGLFLKTTNAGNTWSQLTTVEDFTQDKWFHSLSISYKKVAVRNDYYEGNLFLSTDYSNWTIYNSPAFGYKSSLYFVTDNIGLMSSFAIPTCCPTTPTVKLYKTSDGGLNWIEVAETGGDMLAEFAFPNESIGYFRTGNVILRTPYTGEFQLGNTINLDLNHTSIEMQQVDNSLVVSSDRNDIVSISVYDVAGKLITRKTTDIPAKRIEITNLLKGIYLIRSKCTEIIDNKKIIIL